MNLILSFLMIHYLVLFHCYCFCLYCLVLLVYFLVHHLLVHCSLLRLVLHYILCMLFLFLLYSHQIPKSGLLRVLTLRIFLQYHSLYRILCFVHILQHVIRMDLLYIVFLLHNCRLLFLLSSSDKLSYLCIQRLLLLFLPWLLFHCII